MSSDIVLTSALRSNLLSLQNTQSLIDKTQLNLATGRKVNSALDNPQNFFAAQSLNNRADDLNRLLDGIGQSITAIEQTDTAIQSLTNLVDQADSIAQQARDALAGGTAEAKVTGTRDLAGTTDLTAVNGIANNDTLVISVTDPDGAVEGDLADFDSTANGIQGTLTVTINTNDSIEQLVSEINDNNNLTDRVVEARLNDEGQLEIKALNGGDVSIDFVTANDTDAENLGLAQALGFGDSAVLVGDGAGGNNSVQLTALGTPALESFALYVDDGNGNAVIAERSDLISTLTDSSLNARTANINNAADDIVIGINNGQTVRIETNAQSIQGVIDQINADTSINTLVEASFNEETGRIQIRSIDSEVQSVQFGFSGNNGDETFNLGFGTANNDVGTATEINTENLILGQAAGDLATLESEYDSIRTQIDSLVADSGYRGTNLLNGDDLTTFFNEDRSNSLTTEGATLTAAGLGLSEANFGSVTSVDGALSETRAATLQIREFNASIANDLAVLQTRQDFTTQTINNLTAGADKLTVADQNEEGANLLALQTRQQLGVTSLSLASQSQQAVLRLF